MTRIKIGFIVACNLLLALAALLWYRHTPPLALVCQGNLHFSSQLADDSFSFDGGVTLRFHPDGTGYFTLNGDVSKDRHRWLVSRQEAFRWQQKQDRLYEIAIEKIERYTHDELPDGVFEKYVAGIVPGNRRLLTVTRTPEEAIVIGNFYSPLLICAD